MPFAHDHELVPKPNCLLFGPCSRYEDHHNFGPDPIKKTAGLTSWVLWYVEKFEVILMVSLEKTSARFEVFILTFALPWGFFIELLSRNFTHHLSTCDATPVCGIHFSLLGFWGIPGLGRWLLFDVNCQGMPQMSTYASTFPMQETGTLTAERTRSLAKLTRIASKLES